MTQFAQQRPLKVLVIYDMEGVSGVTDVKPTSFLHSAEYAEGRKSLRLIALAGMAGRAVAGKRPSVVGQVPNLPWYSLTPSQSVG